MTILTSDNMRELLRPESLIAAFEAAPIEDLQSYVMAGVQDGLTRLAQVSA